MPGSSDYFFKLRMHSTDALATARAFKKELKKELQGISATVQVRVSSGQTLAASLASIGRTAAPKMAAPFEKALNTSIKDFESSVKTFGASGFTRDFRSMWTQGMITPAAQSVAEVRKVQRAVVEFGKSTRKMGVSIDEWANMGGVDRWVTAIQAAQRRIWGLRGFGYQMESYGRSLIGTTLAVGAAGAVAGKMYLSFADPLHRAARNLDLNAQLTETLSAELRNLRDEFSAFTPEEQAEGLYLWAAATGAVIDEQDELYSTLAQVEDVQKLAKLGNVSYGQAVEATTDILSQYQKNISETESVVATLIKVAAVSKAEVGDLAQAFSFAGARADNANTSFEETAAALQLLSAFGLRGTRAGRGMGMLFDNLIAPSKEAKAILDELFEDAFGRADMLTNAQGQFVGLAEAVRVLSIAMDDLGEAERDATVARITSQNAARVLIPLLKMEKAGRQENIDVLQEMELILRGVDSANRATFVQMMQDMQGYTVDTASSLDTLDRYWKEYMESIPGRMDNVRSRFSKAMTLMGESVMTEILPHLENAVELLGDFAKAARENEDIIRNIIRGIGLVGIAGVGMVAGGRAIRLVADVKTLLMAKSMRDAANNNMTAAAAMMVASKNQLRAAGLMNAAANTGKSTWMFTGGRMAQGGGVLAGLGGLGLGATLGLAAAAATAIGLFIKYQSDLNQRHLDEAAAVSQASDSYDDYVQAMKDASAEKYILTEATYNLVKAKQEEQDEIDAAALAEYERAVREAALSARMRAEQAFTGMGADLPAMPLEQFEDFVDLVVRGMAPALTQLEVEWIKQGELGTYLAQRYGLVGERAELLALALLQMAYGASAVSGEFASGSMRPPEDLVYELMAAADAQAKLGDEVATAGPKVDATALSWEEYLEKISDLDAESQSVHDAMAAMYDDIVALSGAVPGLSAVVGFLSNRLADLDGMIEGIRFEGIAHAIEVGSGRAVMSLEELMESAKETADQGFGRFEDLAAIMPSEQIMALYDDYTAGLYDLYKRTQGMSERQVQLELARYKEYWDSVTDGHQDAHDEMTKATEDAIKERQRLLEQAQSGFRSMVEQALQPTDVTQGDVWATEAGDYADKWDEAARRMRAAMQDPGGEWGFMIPEDVQARGIEHARHWGNTWLEQFYAGMHPDQIDWDAFVRDFQKGLDAEIGKKALVETAIQKLAGEGITATSEEVMIALGLRSPLESMLLGGRTTEEISGSMKSAITTSLAGVEIAPEEVSGLTAVIGGAIHTGVGQAIQAKPFSMTIIAAWNTDITDNSLQYQALGVRIGDQVWIGFEQSIEGAKFIDVITQRVIAVILEAIGVT